MLTLALLVFTADAIIHPRFSVRDIHMTILQRNSPSFLSHGAPDVSLNVFILHYLTLLTRSGKFVSFLSDIISRMKNQSNTLCKNS